jgi:alcohol dehydrogenase YqhD (iron-dependent ADH family)
MKNPKDYAARAEIMWAGSIAHNNILGTGRIGDWATHMIEHEISAINDIAHGAGLAIIFPAWMKYVYKHNIDRFHQYAVKVWGIDESFGNPHKTILKAIDRQIQFYKSLGLPVTLREVGISKDDFKGMAEKCRKFDPVNETVGNFVKLTKQDIINIFELAY